MSIGNYWFLYNRSTENRVKSSGKSDILLGLDPHEFPFNWHIERFSCVLPGTRGILLSEREQLKYCEEKIIIILYRIFAKVRKGYLP